MTQHSMLDGMPRPLTESEADELIANTCGEIVKHGLWAKMCAVCGTNIGCRLASFGKPHPEDLAYCACPVCRAVGKVRLEFLPPKKEEASKP